MVGTAEQALDTVGKRVAHARGIKGYKNPAALAKALTAHGFPVSRQAIGSLERGAVDQPRQPLIRALAAVLDLPEDYLLYGTRDDEHTFLVELGGLVKDLSDGQQDQLLYLANAMAQETRAKRLADLSDQEAEVIALWRTADPAVRVAMLGGLREGMAPVPAARTSRTVGQGQSGRSA